MWPRVAAERGLEAAGEVRLVDLAAADGGAHGFHAADPRGMRVPEVKVAGTAPSSGSASAGRRRDRERRRARALEPRETRSSQPAGLAPRPRRASGRPARRARATVPRDRPVVERQAHDRQVLVDARERRAAARTGGRGRRRDSPTRPPANGGRAGDGPSAAAGARSGRPPSSRASSARASANGSAPRRARRSRPPDRR